MNPRRSCLILAAALLATLSLARSGAAGEPRWVPLGPPAAPRAARLVVEPGNGNRAYALNEAGLWLSRDGAGSWRSIQAGLGQAPQSVAADPSHPGRLYAAVTEDDSSGGIYRSDDFGAHWTAIFRSGEREASIERQEILVDPHAKDTLLWILDHRLYRSRDAGRTWDCISLGDCSQHSAGTAAFAPGRPKTLYALGVGAGFFVSHDDGRTWTAKFLTVPYLDTLLATREPRTLYAWARDLGYRDLTACFARSDDEGETWKGILPETQCGAPAFDPDDPRTVRMVVVDNRVPQLWLSRDGGDTWTSQGAVPEFGDLYRLPGGGLALATDEGFFRAPSEQGPWRAANRGFGASQIGAVLPVGKAVLAAPVAFINGWKTPSTPLLRTEDGGRSWTGEPLTNPVTLAADPSDPLHLVASALRHEGYDWLARILESRDGGHTWQGIVESQTFRPLAMTLAIDPFEPRTLYAGTREGGLYRSDDGGLTWRSSNGGLPPSHCNHYGCGEMPVHTILPDPDRPGRITLRILDLAFVSQDLGITWTPLRIFEGAGAGVAYALAHDSGGALIVVSSGPQRNDAASAGVVYRSTDGGATWTRLGRLPVSRFIADRINAITGLAATQGALWVSSRFTGVLYSTDGGRTWKPANQGLPLLSVSSLVADPEDPARLYATIPGNGIYTLATP